MTVARKVAQVMDFRPHQPGIQRTAKNAKAERPIKKLREDSDNFKLHALDDYMSK
jgi:hypothetical protein